MNPHTRKTGSGRAKKSNNEAGSSKPSVTMNKKPEHPKTTEKEKAPIRPTAEQIRIAQITDINSGFEDPQMREKVTALMETAQRSEEDVCCALYECDNDLNRAVIYLLESLPIGAFEISSKKKKNRLPSGSGDPTGDEWGDNGASGPNNNDVREKSRNRSGMRGGRGGSDSRGWRGRESRENDRNPLETRCERIERWRGGTRGRGGFRGGRGRIGSRGGNRENNRSNFYRTEETHEVDTWNNSIVAPSVDHNKPDEWGGDWDNEEYTGSLADTKVFTPSASQNQVVELAAPPGMEQQLLNPPSQTDDLVQYSATVVSSTATAGVVAAVNNNQVQYPEIHGSSVALRQALDMPINASLSVEQSQYFNSLSSQNSNQQPSMNAYQVPQSVQYTTNYANNNSYVDQVVSSQQVPTRKQRARVPPPSKIPSTAVEMPGDTLNNIGYLDVQFGGLDFGNDESFDPITEKFSAAIDNPQNIAGDVAADYQTKTSVQQTVLGSQMIPSGDVLSSQNDGLSTTYNQRGSSVQQSVSGGSAISNNAALEQLVKADQYINAVSSAASAYHNQSAYNNNVSSSKSSGYQPVTNQQGYSNSNYSQQVTTANSYSTAASNSYSSYNQSGVNSYQQSNSNNVISTGSSNNSVPVGSGTINSSNVNSGYLSSQYPSSQTSSTYPSQPSNVYQSNQSVYGNTGLSNNTGYANNSNVSAAASQYSNFSNTKLKESIPVTTIYDNAVSSAPSVVANSAITTSSMSSPSLGLTNTKVTSSATKSSGIVPSIPMVSQYIPTGMPFYQQPVYSYEDIQLMQQRMPPVPGYYDINYQTPTSLGAAGVRDGNIGSVAAYSTMSDGRFARNDNNSSPVSNVPSTMSQQTGSGGPMLNLPYAYFYGANMMAAGGFPYGTPAIYPQQMPAGNASSGAQFPKPSYNSGYGSTGYDTLSQTTQDYSKGAYPGTGVGQQSKGQNVTNPPPTGSGSDITTSMYGKSHVALNKVNSYDKQSYSATPPPFNLTGTQTAGANSQGYNTQHMYIQAMPPAGHHIHQPIHQMDGRVQNASRRDSNSTGQRQQSSSQSKSGAKPVYSPSYWAAQN